MARISRNIESGFMYVLGISLNTLLEDARNYFTLRYEREQLNTQEFGPEVPLKMKKGTDYSEVKLSDDDRYIFYVSNKLSKTKIWIYDTERGKTRSFMRQGYKLDRVYDQSYPILDWNQALGTLVVITEKKGKLWLYQVDPKKGVQSKKELLRLEKVLEMDVSPDGKQILFSAINKGQSDIYLYSVAANSQKQLTDDIYDDRYPSFWEDEVIFSSNRRSDTVDLAQTYLEYAPASHYDLYALSLSGKSKVARKLTYTPHADETYGQMHTAKNFLYLSDQSGIRNRYEGYLDSAIVAIDTTIHYRYFTKTQPITGYARNLIEMDANRHMNRTSVADLYYLDERYRVQYIEGIESQETFEPPVTEFKPGETAPKEVKPEKLLEDKSSGIVLIRHSVFTDKREGEQEEQRPGVAPDSVVARDSIPTLPRTEVPSAANDSLIDITNYEFDLEEIPQEKAVKPETNVHPVARDSTSVKVKPFKVPEQRDYDVAFAFTDLTTQFDFDYATDLYQPFNGGPYIMPGMGAFVKVGMLDVFEDYKVEGGFRYSFNNSGSEYFISLEDRTKRLDKKYILQRQTLLGTDQSYPIERKYLYQAKGIFRYPLDEVNALQLTTNVRYDNWVTLATGSSELQKSDSSNYWVGLKIEYIFDNTLFRSLNILNGLRAKVFVEHYRQVLDPASDFTVLGLDVRHYQPIFRDLIWANRLASSSSIGSRKLVYYMGSVDNWIILGARERFDRTTNIANDQGYAYQTIASNMRGFVQNARNGNNFALINSEIRWPVVRFFSNKPLKSEFLSHFQVVGFADVGTAWNGTSPYSDKNAFNKIVVDNRTVRVTYRNQNDPIIGGMGWGLRSKIWGYFVRFDYAWGIENGLFLEPITYLSFGLDF
ncbi:MAG: hypothetical protein Kow0075_14370 [Salibacteraceae bacterium]